ncbi:MAG: hypothetical protein CM15mP55_2570 [Hyphomicrobiales bacterium]|nr:MAG: hypothetical protein CM15mP55_2570 [Hyphomicrobiales bacterium]
MLDKIGKAAPAWHLCLLRRLACGAVYAIFCLRPADAGSGYFVTLGQCGRENLPDLAALGIEATPIEALLDSYLGAIAARQKQFKKRFRRVLQASRCQGQSGK